MLRGRPRLEELLGYAPLGPWRVVALDASIYGLCTLKAQDVLQSPMSIHCLYLVLSLLCPTSLTVPLPDFCFTSRLQRQYLLRGYA